MRGFLFILSVVSTIHRIGSTSDLFQAEEEDIHAGLDITALMQNRTPVPILILTKNPTKAL